MGRSYISLSNFILIGFLSSNKHIYGVSLDSYAEDVISPVAMENVSSNESGDSPGESQWDSQLESIPESYLDMLSSDTNETWRGSEETEKTVRMMKECDPNDESQACENFPQARCLERIQSSLQAHNYVCKCDYLHTAYLDGTKMKCFINVFAPCTYGDTEYACGENMQCQEDSLGIRTGKFCRCLPGFGPVENEYGIPAYCRPITVEEATEKESMQPSSVIKLSVATTNSLILLSIFVSFV